MCVDRESRPDKPASTLASTHTSCGNVFNVWRLSMPQTSIHINQRFGRLIVLELASTKKRRTFQWICRCDCGMHVIASSSRLKRSKVPSCGCYTIERASQLNRKHGYKDHPAYARWKSMMRRCYSHQSLREAPGLSHGEERRLARKANRF